jgi:hypothetical protein
MSLKECFKLIVGLENGVWNFSRAGGKIRKCRKVSDCVGLCRIRGWWDRPECRPAGVEVAGLELAESVGFCRILSDYVI